MVRRGWFADLGFRTLSTFHRGVLKLSGWGVFTRYGSLTVIELRTTGRRSGRPRTVALSAPVFEADRVVLVASRGGDDRHPDWYLNLVANPEVEVTVGRVTRPMRARTAHADERADLWERAIAGYPGYARYQRMTNREIPIVVCEPRSEDAGARRGGRT
jgi:deazaflavin-dependent oxidoreductase (nitroreductase family)